jgi:hypothetical protein
MPAAHPNSPRNRQEAGIVFARELFDLLALEIAKEACLPALDYLSPNCCAFLIRPDEILSEMIRCEDTIEAGQRLIAAVRSETISGLRDAVRIQQAENLLHFAQVGVSCSSGINTKGWPPRYC